MAWTFELVAWRFFSASSPSRSAPARRAHICMNNVCFAFFAVTATAHALPSLWNNGHITRAQRRGRRFPPGCSILLPCSCSRRSAQHCVARTKGDIIFRLYHLPPPTYLPSIRILRASHIAACACAQHCSWRADNTFDASYYYAFYPHSAYHTPPHYYLPATQKHGAKDVSEQVFVRARGDGMAATLALKRRTAHDSSVPPPRRYLLLLCCAPGAQRA